MLFTKYTLGVQTIYSDLKRRALEQSTLLVGTPGSVSERTVKDQRFLYRQYYDPAGKKRADYIGPASDASARVRADTVRAAIEVTNELLGDARLLARAGYVRVDSRSNAVLAALASASLFRMGVVLVGSHAYGTLLNESGIKGSAHLTEDIDIARARQLKLGTLGPPASFARMLAASTVPLTPILGFDRKVPPTSFMAPGRSKLRVDLLVPASGRDIKVVPVPELDAHATALPYLGYLVGVALDAVVIGRDSVVPVSVPRPERFALHKLVVSQLRAATNEKKSKDLNQAAVLVAALTESEPGIFDDAMTAFPKAALSKLRAGARQALAVLPPEHERAIALLRSL